MKAKVTGEYITLSFSSAEEMMAINHGVDTLAEILKESVQSSSSAPKNRRVVPDDFVKVIENIGYEKEERLMRVKREHLFMIAGHGSEVIGALLDNPESVARIDDEAHIQFYESLRSLSKELLRICNL